MSSITTQNDINALVSGFAQAIHSFGIKNVALKLGELLNTDRYSVIKRIESQIDIEVSSAYNLSTLGKSKRNRGFKLEANITKIVLLYIHCGYNQKEIAKIMGEHESGISNKIGNYYKYANNEPMNMNNSVSKVFTPKFISKFYEIDYKIEQYVNQIK